MNYTTFEGPIGGPWHAGASSNHPCHQLSFLGQLPAGFGCEGWLGQQRAAVGSRVMPGKPGVELPSAIDGRILIIARNNVGKPGLMGPRPWQQCTATLMVRKCIFLIYHNFIAHLQPNISLEQPNHPAFPFLVCFDGWSGQENIQGAPRIAQALPKGAPEAAVPKIGPE